MQKIGDIPNSRADNNGEFTDGNVAGGVPPTILPAEWFNTIQREMISVLTAAGITPDSEKFDQVTTAISKLITNGGFLKTANNLSEIKDAGTSAQNTARANIAAADLIGLATQVFSVANATANNHAVNLAQLNSTITALGLGTASKANIGTGSGQVPSMASFTSGPGWMKFPDGTIIQFGTSISGSAGYPASVNFPIPFTADFRVTCSYDTPTSTGDCPAFSTSKIGNTGFYLASSRQGSVTEAGAHWIAIGK